ncbi:hypothetical protein [Sphingomonas soli]|uniref:hypothetical protein n=1 Tax=Sphingomonas soli TaxID=266127 RepID=UPI000AB01200|nr:hypothetical protein [Sphingomonas soli]
MDGEKRAQLYARRAAMLEEKREQDFARRRAEYVTIVPILAALEASGDAYDSHGYRALAGPLNHWACEPDRYPFVQESVADLPADPAARAESIQVRLRQRFSEDDLITVVLRREDLVLALRWPVLRRHFETLLDNAEGDWLAFVAPPADWVIAVRRSLLRDVAQIFTGRFVARD